MRQANPRLLSGGAVIAPRTAVNKRISRRPVRAPNPLSSAPGCSLERDLPARASIPPLSATNWLLEQVTHGNGPRTAGSHRQRRPLGSHGDAGDQDLVASGPYRRQRPGALRDPRETSSTSEIAKAALAEVRPRALGAPSRPCDTVCGDFLTHAQVPSSSLHWSRTPRRLGASQLRAAENANAKPMRADATSGAPETTCRAGLKRSVGFLVRALRDVGNRERRRRCRSLSHERWR